MTQQEAQAINYRIATEWYRGCGIKYNGVDLGRALEYEFMRVIGRVLKQALTPVEESSNVDGHAE